MYTRVSMEVSKQLVVYNLSSKLTSYIHMAYNPFTKYHEHPSMYKYLYTWNPNDL